MNIHCSVQFMFLTQNFKGVMVDYQNGNLALGLAYLESFPQHASNVALVLNLKTGLVSPQFHVVFDNKFSTVEYLNKSKEPPNWQNLVEHHSEHYILPIDSEPTTSDPDSDRLRNEIAQASTPQSPVPNYDDF